MSRAMLDPEWLAQTLLAAAWADRRPSRTFSTGRSLRGTVSTYRVRLDFGDACRRFDGKNPRSVLVAMPAEGAKSPPGAWVFERQLPSCGVPAPAGRVVRLPDGERRAVLLRDVPAVPLVPSEIRWPDACRVVETLASMHARFWESPPRGAAEADATLDAPMTLVHGAPGGGTAVLGRTGVLFLDWGRAAVGPGVADLESWLAALPAWMRGRNEWDLVGRYHATLVRGGVVGYAMSDCWKHLDAFRTAHPRHATAA